MWIPSLDQSSSDGSAASNQNQNNVPSAILNQINEIYLYELLPKVQDINKQEIGDLIDQEMHNTSEAIEAAVARLEVKFKF